MKHFLFAWLLAIFVISCSHKSYSQAFGNSSISGSFQTDFQYYVEDSAIGAPDVPEESLMNGFLQLQFSSNNFEAGIRYEAYYKTLLGFDPRYNDPDGLGGRGIANRYATFRNEGLEITAGNFYEQFGSGMILRSYWEWNLGFDNSFDGLRIRYSPSPGVYLKGLIGRQRNYWELGPGIVRGFDGEVNINELSEKLSAKKTRLTIGGSLVSKFQRDEDPILKLPENVASFAGRFNLISGNFQLQGEFVYKYNDPGATNNQIYKEGTATQLTGSYTKRGLGIIIGAKRIDNLDFRSDRNATVQDLQISFHPPINRQYTYRLPTLYPYATQPVGEMGAQAEIFYKFKKGSPLGGKYGTKIDLSASTIFNIDQTPYVVADTNQVDEMLGYTSDFFKVGDEKYFQDIGIVIEKKLSKDLTINLEYTYLVYNKDVIEGVEGFGTVYAHVSIAEFQYKLNRTHSLRGELQHMYTEQDFGDWAMVLLEYSIAPKWFVAAWDEFNYGNDVEDEQFHYPNVRVGYTQKANRFTLGYGRQRAGLLCVGGVCRVIPASNGLTVTVTSSF